MSGNTRIVFDEDGYPRELIDMADMKRAIDRDELRHDMTVVVYRTGSTPNSQIAADVSELRSLFGLPEIKSAMEDNSSSQNPGFAQLDYPVEHGATPSAPLNSIYDNVGTSSATFHNEHADAVAKNEPNRRQPLVPARLSESVLSRDNALMQNDFSNINDSIGAPFRSHFNTHFIEMSGRETREQYFSFAGTIFVFIVIASGVSALLGTLVALGFSLPIWSATVRRLHDSGYSGWLLLIGLIPYIGSVILLILLLQPSSISEKYGPIIEGSRRAEISTY